MDAHAACVSGAWQEDSCDADLCLRFPNLMHTQQLQMLHLLRLSGPELTSVPDPVAPMSAAGLGVDLDKNLIGSES